MTGELVPRPDGRPARRVDDVPVERGVKVCLIDDRGYRMSEWVPIVERGTYLFAEWEPGTDGYACAYVAWDEVNDRFAAGLLDVAVLVGPKNAPVELRVEPGDVRPIHRVSKSAAIERFAFGLDALASPMPIGLRPMSTDPRRMQ